MFEVKINVGQQSYFLGDGSGNYLHCDGRSLRVCEYFPTQEDAQAILDKFQPKPKHVWKHGDVFRSGVGFNPVMIYMKYESSSKFPQAFCLNGPIGDPAINLACLNNAKFLFNIKDKI